MIHVCFALYDATGRYSKFTGTAMLSLLKNTASEIAVHILHDATLTPDNREKLLRIAERFNQRVNFYNVEEFCAAELNFLRNKLAAAMNSRLSIATFYRLLVKKILAPRGVRKVIYLDSDLIVNLDIAELWRQDLQNFPIAVVPEEVATLGGFMPNKFLILTGRVRAEDYFCSGVMIIDLEKFADGLLADAANFLADKPQCDSLDQDFLNAVFSANYLKLENRFDSFVPADRWRKLPVAKKIYHYTGNSIGLDYSDGFNRLWLDCFSQTPWLDGDLFNRMNAAYKKPYLELFCSMKDSLARLSATMSGKARGFFVMANDLDTLKKIFAIRDDEEVILADAENSVANLAISMNNASGKKIFFVVVPDFKLVSDLLQQLRFVPDKDFLDASKFIMLETESDFPPFPLLKAL